MRGLRRLHRILDNLGGGTTKVNFIEIQGGNINTARLAYVFHTHTVTFSYEGCNFTFLVSKSFGAHGEPRSPRMDFHELEKQLWTKTTTERLQGRFRRWYHRSTQPYPWFVQLPCGP